MYPRGLGGCDARNCPTSPRLSALTRRSHPTGCGVRPSRSRTATPWHPSALAAGAPPALTPRALPQPPPPLFAGRLRRRSNRPRRLRQPRRPLSPGPSGPSPRPPAAAASPRRPRAPAPPALAAAAARCSPSWPESPPAQTTAFRGEQRMNGRAGGHSAPALAVCSAPPTARSRPPLVCR